MKAVELRIRLVYDVTPEEARSLVGKVEALPLLDAILRGALSTLQFTRQIPADAQVYLLMGFDDYTGGEALPPELRPTGSEGA